MLKANGFYSFQKRDGETVNLLFNTWAFRKFCEKKNLTLNELFDILTSHIGLHDLCDLVYCAGLSYATKNKQEASFSEYDATEWMDDLMFGNNAVGVSELMAALKQWISPDIEPDKIVEEEEKKS